MSAVLLQLIPDHAHLAEFARHAVDAIRRHIARGLEAFGVSVPLSLDHGYLIGLRKNSRLVTKGERVARLTQEKQTHDNENNNV